MRVALAGGGWAVMGLAMPGAAGAGGSSASLGIGYVPLSARSAGPGGTMA